VSGAFIRERQKQKRKKQRKLAFCFLVSVSGVVGADPVGQVVGHMYGGWLGDDGGGGGGVVVIDLLG
jgi:hypothetical protein